MLIQATYESIEPQPVGNNCFMYGYYCVLIDDFVFISPHTALKGTVSAQPIDLELNPEFEELLIGQALKMRNRSRPLL